MTTSNDLNTTGAILMKTIEIEEHALRCGHTFDWDGGFFLGRRGLILLENVESLGTIVWFVIS